MKDYVIHFDHCDKADIKIQMHQGRGFARAIYELEKEELEYGRISLWGPRGGLIKEAFANKKRGDRHDY